MKTEMQQETYLSSEKFDWSTKLILGIFNKPPRCIKTVLYRCRIGVFGRKSISDRYDSQIAHVSIQLQQRIRRSLISQLELQPDLAVTQTILNHQVFLPRGGYITYDPSTTMNMTHNSTTCLPFLFTPPVFRIYQSTRDFSPFFT